MNETKTRKKHVKTELDHVWDEALECARAYRKRPSKQNRSALDTALSAYRDAVAADFFGESEEAGMTNVVEAKTKAAKAA